MQLIAGRTAQEYNQRKGKQGAFREDRYHATAVQADEHLHRCMVYIELNSGSGWRILKPVPGVQTFHRCALFKTFQTNRSFKVQGSMFKVRPLRIRQVERVFGSGRFSKSAPGVG